MAAISNLFGNSAGVREKKFLRVIIDGHSYSSLGNPLYNITQHNVNYLEQALGCQRFEYQQFIYSVDKFRTEGSFYLFHC